MLFGATSSHFMLTTVQQIHLETFTANVTQDMKEYLYVDNITGFKSVDKAFTCYEESREFTSRAGVNLPSWPTNSKPFQEQPANGNVLDANWPVVNVLGLHWSIISDTLFISSKKLTPC